MSRHPLILTLIASLVVGTWSYAPDPPAARAAGVVGTGTPASCTEAAFVSALSGGGDLSFNCGAAPHTIGFTQARMITADTRIDGGGLITLSGQDATRLFVVAGGVSLALDQVTLSHGAIAGYGGAIVSNGTLTITDSLFEHNQALVGGALSIHPSIQGGSTTIINSIFRDNEATDLGLEGGGAINVADETTVSIAGSEFLANSGKRGGAILIADNASAMIVGSDFISNTALSVGGGIYTGIGATLVVSTSTIHGNRAVSGGGLFNGAATAAVTDTTFSDNQAREGAGLLNINNTVSLNNVTFNGNIAEIGGGGVYNDDGAVAASSVTFSGNAALYGGGYMNVAQGSADFVQVTFFHNTGGAAGGAIYVDSAQSAVSVKGSIVASSVAGGNCSGPVGNGGFNLATDSTCQGFNTVSSLMLDPLASNGGSTWTHLPQPGSPAIDFVASACPPPAVDQRGLSRLVDGNGDGIDRCDAGAVERQSVGPELLARLFLPALTR